MSVTTNPALDPGHSQPVTISVTEEELRMAPKELLVHDHLDGIQHGLDDDPTHDAQKGSALGALGGAAVGATAGAILGPAGMAVGALAGAVSGAPASGLAVATVDAVDNDNSVTSLGAEVSVDADQFPPEQIHTITREKQETL